MATGQMQEIINYTEEYIMQSISEYVQKYTGIALKTRPRYNKPNDSIAIQFWYCEPYNKLYVYYKITDFFARRLNARQLYLDINRKILRRPTRQFKMYIEILGPAAEATRKDISVLKDRRVIMKRNEITPRTYTYWRLGNEGYDYYIEDPYNIITDYETCLLDYPNTLTVDPKLKNFYNQILEWNKTYFDYGKKIGDKNTVSFVFNLYKEEYQTLFGKILQKVPDDEIDHYYLDFYKEYD